MMLAGGTHREVTQCQYSTHSPPYGQSLEELSVGGVLATSL
jgi:hypothetical protein